MTMMASIAGLFVRSSLGAMLELAAGPSSPAMLEDRELDTVAEPRDPEDARQRARALAALGDAAFEARLYDEAINAYREAYALDPVPVFLFVWARVEQEAGRCREAIALYRRFLDTGPPPRDVDQANLEVGRCYGELAKQEEAANAATSGPAPTPKPPRPESEVETKPEPGPEPPPRRAPWLRDPWGGVMVATGVVGLGAGTGLYLRAQAEVRGSERAETTDDFRRASRRAAALSGGGIASWTVGSALMIGAVVRYAVVARRGGSPRLGASPLGLWGRF